MIKTLPFPIQLLCWVMALPCMYTNANAQIAFKRLTQKTDFSRDSILYQSDFNTITEGPSINHGDTAVSKVENGNFVMDVKRANRYWTLHLGSPAFIEKPTLIEIKFKIVSDSTNRSFGLCWNAKLNEEKVWEDFDFMLATNSTFSIFFSKDDHDDVQISGWQYCNCIDPADYNILRIERLDSLYKFYINNSLVFQQKLPPMNLMFGGLYVHPHSILYVDYVKMGVFRK